MKKTICLAVILAAVMLLVSCGDGEKTEQTNSSSAFSRTAVSSQTPSPSSSDNSSTASYTAEKTYASGDYMKMLDDVYGGCWLGYGYAFKDIDGDGSEELLATQNTVVTAYDCKGEITEIGNIRFSTGTLQLLYTGDEEYPGIVTFTVGGGKNHYGYMTIKDGELVNDPICDIDYSAATGRFEDVYYTRDERLIELARAAYDNEQRIPLIDVEAEK